MPKDLTFRAKNAALFHAAVGAEAADR